jgi:hypothetical protein
MKTAEDLGRRHWMTRGMCMLDSETGHTPHTSLADA